MAKLVDDHHDAKHNQKRNRPPEDLSERERQVLRNHRRKPSGRVRAPGPQRRANLSLGAHETRMNSKKT
jgi:hypothetical protein